MPVLLNTIQVGHCYTLPVGDTQVMPRQSTQPILEEVVTTEIGEGNAYVVEINLWKKKRGDGEREGKGVIFFLHHKPLGSVGLTEAKMDCLLSDIKCRFRVVIVTPRIFTISLEYVECWRFRPAYIYSLSPPYTHTHTHTLTCLNGGNKLARGDVRYL